ALSGVKLVFNGTRIPVDKTVSLVAARISLRESLASLLKDTGYEPALMPSGSVVLVSRAWAGSAHLDALQGSATLMGQVYDSATGASIPQVRIRIDGSAEETISGHDGQYKISGLSAGDYRITVRRVGYLAKTYPITIGEGENKTLNVALSPPATQLNEVV